MCMAVLQVQYQTNFAFIALREGSGENEHLRIVAAYSTEDNVDHLTNRRISPNSEEGDELLWDCLSSTESKVVEDGSVLSMVDDEMCVPFLLSAATKPGVETEVGLCVCCSIDCRLCRPRHKLRFCHQHRPVSHSSTTKLMCDWSVLG